MIVLDARYVRERPSGIGKMVDEVVRRVPAMMPDVDFVFLRHPRARSPLSAEPNTRDVTVRSEANGPATLVALPELVDLRGARLLHLPYNILGARVGVPTLVTVHDVMWLMHPALCRRPGPWGLVETAFYQAGIRHALRRATYLAAVSEATKTAIAALDPRAGARVTVTPHGVDAEFRPATTLDEHSAIERARDRYAPGADRFVLTVGQAAPYKNHRRVVEAFLSAFRDDPATHLVLVQRLGSEARALLERARAAGAEARVHVLPTVPFEELLGLYRGALCLCHPSIVEGWGMPVTEALACGCPVVTSGVSSMPEVTAGAAVFVDPESTDSIAEGLGRVARDDALRSRLSAQGLERARSLTWAEHARRTAALYRRALDESSA